MPLFVKVEASDSFALRLWQKSIALAVLLLAIDDDVSSLLTKVVQVEHQLIPHLRRQVAKSRARIDKAIVPCFRPIDKMIIYCHSRDLEFVTCSVLTKEFKPHHFL
jgi:hypothetical protein